jgi:uncharacterized protein (TIGR00661 family)
MKYLFLVQGEGRGHMTQAIELARILEKFGHEVVHTFIGESKRRKIPDYFYHKIPSVIESIKSPNFILSRDNKSLDLWKSITFNSKYLGTYKKSLDRIHQKVKHFRPDAVINFYDFIGGFYFRFYKPKNVRHVCIGRQFLTLHPDYPFAPDRDVEKKLYLLNNKLTAQCCDKYLALSFRPYEPRRIGNMVVMPPLIKEETKNAQTVLDDFILGYLVNDGYAEDVIDQHKNMPELKIHCFWDRKGMPSMYSPHEHLTFHQIDNQLFTDYMTRCKGYISTAGFESICEAMYLGKPTLMFPVASQYEQACNAIDGELSGAGKKAASFDISQLLDVIDNYQTPENFKQWVSQAEVFFNEELTNF